MTKPDGGPAFGGEVPTAKNANGESVGYVKVYGMSLREYAAIKLKVPKCKSKLKV